MREGNVPALARQDLEQIRFGVWWGRRLDQMLFPETFPVFVRFHQRARAELRDPMDNPPEAQPIYASRIFFVPGFERLPWLVAIISNIKQNRIIIKQMQRSFHSRSLAGEPL